jgi:hypothetical protein
LPEESTRYFEKLKKCKKPNFSWAYTQVSRETRKIPLGFCRGILGFCKPGVPETPFFGGFGNFRPQLEV